MEEILLAASASALGFVLGVFTQSYRQHRQEHPKDKRFSGNQRVWPKLFAVFPGGWDGGGGIVHAYNLSLHPQAADWYVASFKKITDVGQWDSTALMFTIPKMARLRFSLQLEMALVSAD